MHRQGGDRSRKYLFHYLEFMFLDLSQDPRKTEDENVKLHSKHFIFNNPVHFIIQVLISSLRVISIPSGSQQTFIVTYMSSDQGTNRFNVNVRSQKSNKNLIESMTFSAVIVSLASFNNKLSYY